MSIRAAWQKLQIFKIQYGGPPPFWKSLNRHISVKNRPILMKCGTLHWYWARLQSRDQKLQFLKFKMAAAAILKIAFWPLLINRLSDFSEILYEKAEQHADKGYRTNMQMCKIQDGGRPLFWKSLNRHISVKNCQILMKFSTLHQIFKMAAASYSHVTKKMKFLEFKMAATAILKFAFLVITHRPIVGFRRNFVCGSRTSCRHRPHNKNCKFSKFNMADGRHFENR